MQAGTLRDPITIEQKTVSGKDAYGADVYTWTTFATVWGQVQNLRLRDYIAARASEVDLEMQVNVRYIAGVTGAMRVKIGDNAWAIASVVDVNQKHVRLEILCKGPAVPT